MPAAAHCLRGGPAGASGKPGRRGAAGGRRAEVAGPGWRRGAAGAGAERQRRKAPWAGPPMVRELRTRTGRRYRAARLPPRAHTPGAASIPASAGGGYGIPAGSATKDQATQRRPPTGPTTCELRANGEAKALQSSDSGRARKPDGVRSADLCGWPLRGRAASAPRPRRCALHRRRGQAGGGAGRARCAPARVPGLSLEQGGPARPLSGRRGAPRPLSARILMAQLHGGTHGTRPPW